MARYKRGNSAEERRDVECNGWRNWDTWSVGVVVYNDRRANEFVRKNKQKLLKMNKEEQIQAIKDHSNTPLRGVSTRNVDRTELSQLINDL